MKSRLKILLPITFPNAASLCPLTEDIMLTNNSGVEVPKATTVKPTARLDTLNFLATEEEPLTKKSAPLIRITKPINNRVNVNSIDY
jgi:hypothetical protein